MGQQLIVQAWHNLKAWRFSQTFRRRVAGHLMFWSIGWPLCILAAAIFEARQTPCPLPIPLHVMLGLASGGALILLPELLGCMFVLSVATIAIFTVLGSRQARRIQCCCEAMLAFFSLSVGVALEYPSILNFAYFALMRPLSCQTAFASLLLLILLAGILLGLRQQSRIGALRGAATVAILVFVGWSIARQPVYSRAHPPASHNVVLMGIDSLSQDNDLSVIRNIADEHKGIYYTNAVTSGLMTNAVWTSIVMHRPVHTTGVLLTFQSADWNRSRFNLVKAAESAGYETWSFITDQSTTYIGNN